MSWLWPKTRPAMPAPMPSDADDADDDAEARRQREEASARAARAAADGGAPPAGSNCSAGGSGVMCSPSSTTARSFAPRSAARSSGSVLAPRTRLRPWSFARYTARSAWWISSFASTPSFGKRGDAERDRGADRLGRPSRPRTRARRLRGGSARRSPSPAPGASPAGGSRTPRRRSAPARRSGAAAARKISAIPLRTASPARWP